METPATDAPVQPPAEATEPEAEPTTDVAGEAVGDDELLRPRVRCRPRLFAAGVVVSAIGGAVAGLAMVLPWWSVSHVVTTAMTNAAASERTSSVHAVHATGMWLGWSVGAAAATALLVACRLWFGGHTRAWALALLFVTGLALIAACVIGTIGAERLTDASPVVLSITGRTTTGETIRHSSGERVHRGLGVGLAAAAGVTVIAGGGLLSAARSRVQPERGME